MSTDERLTAEIAEPGGMNRRNARRKGPARPRKWTRPSERARLAPEIAAQPLDESEIEEAISAADIQFRKVQQEIRRRIAERAEAARLAHLAADERREAAVIALQSLAHANEEKRRPIRDDGEDQDQAPEAGLFAPQQPAEESAWPAPRVTAGFLLFTSLCTAASAILVNGFVTGSWPLIDGFSGRVSAEVPAVTLVEQQPALTLPAAAPEAAPPAEPVAPALPVATPAGDTSRTESAETARAVQSWARSFARPAPPLQASATPATAPNTSAVSPDIAETRARAGTTPPLPVAPSRGLERQASEQPDGEVTITPAANVAEQIAMPGPGVSAAGQTIELDSGQPPAAAAEEPPVPQIEARLQAPDAAEDQPQAGTVTQADQLIESGQTYLSHGDISSARLYFERAAELGDVRALIGLARTYDPVIFEQLGVLGMKPDAEKAMQYYLKARAAGSVDALAGIDALALYLER
jgi:hypothetical protein